MNSLQIQNPPLATLLGDVPDENISLVFGTRSGTAWKATGEGIPETVREYAEYIRDGSSDSDGSNKESLKWQVDTFAQEILSVELSDGTNVIQDTDYIYSSSQTTT